MRGRGRSRAFVVPAGGVPTEILRPLRGLGAHVRAARFGTVIVMRGRGRSRAFVVPAGVVPTEILRPLRGLGAHARAARFGAVIVMRGRGMPVGGRSSGLGAHVVAGFIRNNGVIPGPRGPGRLIDLPGANVARVGTRVVRRGESRAGDQKGRGQGQTQKG